MIMFIVQNAAREWFTKAAVSFARVVGGVCVDKHLRCKGGESMVFVEIIGLIVIGVILLVCGITWALFAYYVAQELLTLLSASPVAFLVVLMLFTLFSFLGFLTLAYIFSQDIKKL